jgi:hypothetical protein
MYVSMLSVGTLLLGAISSEEFSWFTKLKEHSDGDSVFRGRNKAFRIEYCDYTFGYSFLSSNL